VVTVKKLSLALGVPLLIAATLGVPATAGKKGAVHEPPYKQGPSGGDEFNHVESDPQSGRMAVVRTFPGIPPVVGCTPEPSAGWGMFRVKHDVDQPVSEVTLAYDAGLDPYAWITVGARDEKGDWLGVKKFQGPFAGSGKLTAKLFENARPGETITIEFGLQLGDACPQVGFAAASFPSVTIK
jgi:hypothetical protein